ncbi:MAG: gliding motility-associated C-terminal domain-containing protein [Paludibacteraceae bacterium]|nr:gliding motility-associated C-terminal domain-containing protein [Paludibacteraceae bacterium]
MKNLISYKKSGLNALRKAFSLIVVLCAYLQSVNSQEFIVEGWYQVSESESRVVPVDACGAVYHAYITPSSSSDAKFAIKYANVKGGIKAVSSSISTSDLIAENDYQGKGLCQFTIPSGSSLREFYLDMTKSPIAVSESAPVGVDAITISTESRSSVNLGSTIKFTSLFCSSKSNTDLSYSWQISKDGETWIKPSSTYTEKEFEYTVLSDIKYVRCEATYTDPSGDSQTITSNVIELTLNDPTFNVQIIGEGVRDINKSEKEVPSWHDVVIKMIDLPSQNVSNPKISFKPLGSDESYKPLDAAVLNDDKMSWSLYANKSGKMRIEVDVEVPASDGTSTTVTLKKEFLFRLVYSPDKDDAVQELFYDDFGYFVGNEYHYVKYESGTPVDQDAVETLSTKLPENVEWMDDKNGFIKEHSFALEDPRTDYSSILEEGKINIDRCWSMSEDNRPYRCWCENGFRVEDGYYAFVSNPAMADGGAKSSGENDYWNGTDHTGNTDGTKHGAMLMVNCAKNALDAVIYERDFEITGECANVMVLFSAFVSNAQGIIPEGGTTTPVNVRMDIYEKGGTQVLTSIESGDVITRNYGANSWSNLTALFPLSNKDNTNGSKFYTLKITNNAPSGSGNDILLDDISLKVCFPEIEVKANVTADETLDEHNIVICGKSKNLTLTAFNRAGIENYIPTPYYLFQYFDDTDSTWKNLPKGVESTESAISEDPTMDIKLSKKDFSGDTKFRVVVGNSKETIQKLVTDGIAKPNCMYTYAISEDFHVKFNPVGEDLDLFGCIGETIDVNADANGRPTIEWIDYSGKALTTNDSITSINKDKLTFVIPESILKSNNKSDTLYMIATTEGGLCSDTQIVSITKYDDLDFNIENDTFYCEFDKSLKAVDLYPTSGINYVWKLKGSNLEDQTGSEYKVLKSNPEIFDNTVTVTGTADKFCPTTKTADFSIYRRYKLDLTVDVEGANEKEANICLPTDGESSSRVDLKVKKVYADGSNPSYAEEKVTTYFWYRKDGDKDSVLIGQGTETSFVDRLTDNNIYKYSVAAVDEVCYKNDAVATSDSSIINARKPLIVKLTEDKEEICEKEEITLNVKITNALKVDTITSRFFENGKSLTSLLGSDKNYSYVPTNGTKEKVTKNIKVEVMDMICSPSKPVTDSVKFDVFVPLVVSLSTDADGDQKCIRKDNGDDFVNVTLTVEQGNPRSVVWFDGLYPGLVFNRPVTVNQGENKISVKVYDEVCRATDATGLVEGADTSKTIIASEPIIISLAADKDSICNGETVEMDMNVKNSLTSGPEVRWYERYNGVEDLKYTDRSTKTSKTHTPVNPTDFVVKKTMIVKTVDNICNAGKDVMDSVSYNIFIPIKLNLTHDAVLNGNVIQKCITQANVDNVVNLEVKVTAGNPSKLIWSDGNYNDAAAPVYMRQFVVSPGTNSISVVGSDGVCSSSASDNDALDIVAASPITLELSTKNPDVCDGADIDFELKVNNTLDDKVEVRWYEEDTKLYTTNGASLTKAHTSSNNTNSKLGKTMVVKVDDEICSKGTEVSTSADYTVYKPVKYYLTSDAAEFDVPNTKCLGQTSQGSQTSADIKVNLTQGNPVKFVWSDEVEWNWKWGDPEEEKHNVTVRNFDLKLGKNTLSVTAYDNVCNKEGDEAQFVGEGQNISIEARTPIKIGLDLASGRNVMCKGEDISLVATVHNDMDGEKTKLEWNEYHGVADGLVDNGSYTTDKFMPEQGEWTYSVKASENVANPICPSQTASYSVSVQVNTTLKVYASEDAICQDTSGRDTVKLIRLTARVITGKPQGIIWSTGDTTRIDTGYSFLNVAPMNNRIYSAYGFDSVCVKTTPAYSDTIDVDHRIYVTLSADDYKVQMGDEVSLKTDYTLPADGVRYYEMVSPNEVELERNHDSEFSWQLNDPGRYQFIVKLENGNCGVRSSNIITVDVADYVLVPNVITPYNGNPKNDKFMEGYDVKIFNRYQETVYEGTDGWDATYRGELATPGTYFYILTKKDGRVLKGTVEVYRK